MFHFFAYLARLTHIQRWGLMRSAKQENTAEHSLQTAMFAHGLALIRNRYFDGKIDPLRVMALAMYHDATEVITGDLPTPIKYFSKEIKGAYQDLEVVARDKLLAMLPVEMQGNYRMLFSGGSPEEHQLVKAADTLSAYLKCVDEMKYGNREFEKALVTVKTKLDEMNLPEVEYFLREFAPSFALTLDELN